MKINKNFNENKQQFQMKINKQIYMKIKKKFKQVKLINELNMY